MCVSLCVRVCKKIDVWMSEVSHFSQQKKKTLRLGGSLSACDWLEESSFRFFSLIYSSIVTKEE